MNKRIPLLLLVLSMGVAASRAEEVVVPLPSLQGPYDTTQQSQRQDHADAELTFYAVYGARIHLAGEASGVYGYEYGGECESQTWYALGSYFHSLLLEGESWNADASTDEYGDRTYPNPEPFDTVRSYRLRYGRNWAFLLDGQADVRVVFVNGYEGFCQFVPTAGTPRGVLDTVELLISGRRMGDFDADGDVDASDAASFEGCYTGIGGTAPAVCGPGDFDRDGDVDCTDHDRFVAAWTGQDTPPPLPACVIPALSVNAASLSWTLVEPALAYDVVQGSVTALREADGDFAAAVDLCLADDHPLLVLEFSGRPDAGEALWLLVRAVTPTGPLTYDTLRASQVGARDAEIESSTQACP